jgi:hypothetical protein
MLRKTLAEIVEVVRSEAKLSTNTSRGIDHGDYIRTLIRTTHESLAEDYEWPHLRLRRGDSFKTLAAGQRYYDFPVNLNVQFIEGAYVQWGASWLPLVYGITAENYTSLDSDDDQRADPVQAWEWYSNDGLNQFEVWPIPAQNDVVIAFEGRRAINPLVEENDRADIDHLVIAYTVAAEILADNGKKESAALKIDKATSRLNRLMANARGATPQGFVMGGNDPNLGRRGHVRNIRYVRGNPS